MRSGVALLDGGDDAVEVAVVGEAVCILGAVAGGDQGEVVAGGDVAAGFDGDQAFVGINRNLAGVDVVASVHVNGATADDGADFGCGVPVGCVIFYKRQNPQRYKRR